METFILKAPSHKILNQSHAALGQDDKGRKENPLDALDPVSNAVGNPSFPRMNTKALKKIKIYLQRDEDQCSERSRSPGQLMKIILKIDQDL
ncbi:MAG TPA: hypothetical protein VLO29_08840 [Salegentibacter sp.]|nr:hypothetical protein [Salegentibacter sp.]